MVLLEATHITVAATLTGLVLGVVYGWIAAQSLLGSTPTLPDFTPAGLVAPHVPVDPDRDHRRRHRGAHPGRRRRTHAARHAGRSGRGARRRLTRSPDAAAGAPTTCHRGPARAARSRLDGCRLPFDQSTYQVRLDWGVDGLDRLAPADVVVVVDVLRFSSTVADAVASGVAGIARRCRGLVAATAPRSPHGVPPAPTPYGARRRHPQRVGRRAGRGDPAGAQAGAHLGRA